MSYEGCCKAEVSSDKESTRGGKFFRPPVDIVETADELVVVADVPGASTEEIEVKFENGVLSVLAPVKVRQQNGKKSVHREFETGGYFRSFEIGEGIDPSRISAQYVDGVLTLKLPKSEQTKTRKIPVQ